MEYTGCANTEHRGLKDRVLPWSSMVRRAAKCHCQAAEFLQHIFFFKDYYYLKCLLGLKDILQYLQYYKMSFKKRAKGFKYILNSVEYTITRERVFLFPWLKTLLGHSNRWNQCNHHEPSCGVAPAEKADKLLLFLSTLVSSWSSISKLRSCQW